MAPWRTHRARTERNDAQKFLRLTPEGQIVWLREADEATAFASMREAMRMAMRLPGTLRANGLPLGGEPISPPG